MGIRGELRGRKRGSCVVCNYRTSLGGSYLKTIEESWKIGFIVILMKTLSPIDGELSSIINHRPYSTWWFGEAELGEMKEHALNHFFPSPLHSMSALPKVISALTQRYALFIEDESLRFIS